MSSVCGAHVYISCQPTQPETQLATCHERWSELETYSLRLDVVEVDRPKRRPQNGRNVLMEQQQHGCALIETAHLTYDAEHQRRVACQPPFRHRLPDRL
jgi:hypothetical protein